MGKLTFAVKKLTFAVKKLTFAVKKLTFAVKKLTFAVKKLTFAVPLWATVNISTIAVIVFAATALWDSSRVIPLHIFLHLVLLRRTTD